MGDDVGEGQAKVDDEDGFGLVLGAVDLGRWPDVAGQGKATTTVSTAWPCDGPGPGRRRAGRWRRRRWGVNVDVAGGWVDGLGRAQADEEGSTTTTKLTTRPVSDGVQ